MVFQGHIEHGVVVFREPVTLPDGTPVRVEAVEPDAGDFWKLHSLRDLAQRQRISAPLSVDEMLGGWPEDELDDGFEDEVTSWRERELERDE